jgi:hypothetical protein
MRLTSRDEDILIDALNGGHIWGEPENRLNVDRLMDLHLFSVIQGTRRANGDLPPRIAGGISDSGRKLAMKLEVARSHVE